MKTNRGNRCACADGSEFRLIAVVACCGMALSLCGPMLLAVETEKGGGGDSEKLRAVGYIDVDTTAEGGPLNHLFLGVEASTQIAHIDDGSTYEVYPPSTKPGDYGTFLVVDGALYAPDFSNHGGSATGSLGSYTAFTPISQTDSSSGNTRRVTTRVGVGSTGIEIEMVDTYVIGQESYRTDTTLFNTGGTSYTDLVLYRAMDCYLGGSDNGYGVDVGTSVGCTKTEQNTPPDRVEQFVPFGTDNNYYEAFYAEVWAYIATKQPFDDTCRCGEHIDNGAGISWVVDLPGGGSVTKSHMTVFSPTGTVDLAMDKQADSSVSLPGDTNGYTITIFNPNPMPVNVTSITDTLDPIFTYIPGSTTGVTSLDPTIALPEHTWNGPFTVPSAGSITLHFEVLVAAVAKSGTREAVTYLNSVRATTDGVTGVASFEGGAPITIDPNSYLQFASEGYLIDEQGGGIAITVQRVGYPLAEANVTYATADGTATAGLDYAATTGVLSWSDGDTADQFIVINVYDDTAIEEGETILLTLSNPSGGVAGVSEVLLGSPATTLVSINDRTWREFQVNTYTTSIQTRPKVDLDPIGRAVVAWDSFGQDGAGWGVFGQRVDSSGIFLGSEFQINTYTTSNQRDVDVASFDNSRFVAVWESSNQDGSLSGIYGQRFGAGGGPLGGEFRVNTYTTGHQSDPSVAVDANGSFMVVWQSEEQDGDGSAVVGRLYDPVGVPLTGELAVNQWTTADQVLPDVAAADSGFVVVWQSYAQESAGNGIIGRRFNSAGAPIGSEFVANSYTVGHQENPAVASTGGGAFTVVWEGANHQDGFGLGVFGQRYAANGTRIGGEFQVNTHTMLDQEDATVGMDDDGQIVVAWESVEQDGSGRGVYTQSFLSDGSAMLDEFRVNAYVANAQHAPDAVRGVDDLLAVVWASAREDGDLDGVHMLISNVLPIEEFIFADGFETGDTSMWSATVPPP